MQPAPQPAVQRHFEPDAESGVGSGAGRGAATEACNVLHKWPRNGRCTLHPQPCRDLVAGSAVILTASNCTGEILSDISIRGLQVSSRVTYQYMLFIGSHVLYIRIRLTAVYELVYYYVTQLLLLLCHATIVLTTVYELP